MSVPEKKTFWLDGFEGKARGGAFVRNDLFKQVARFKENEIELVGIIVEEGSYNLELLIREKEEG